MSNSILVDPVTNHRDTVNLIIKGCTKVGLAQLINPGSESRLKKEKRNALVELVPVVVLSYLALMQRSS
jgi:hypothetical protein